MPDLNGKIRYAVVGGGSISQGAFMPGVGQTENSILTALVTSDQNKADKLAKRYALKSYSYTQYGELLASGEIDAVYVATPNFMHREFVVPALEAGIHVLLEKPMASNEDDCKAMQAAAHRSNAKFMIAYRLHFEPGTLEMIERVHAGDFGQPRLFTSTFTQTVKPTNHRMQNGFAAGPVLDMGPYPLNMVRQLLGEEPIEVSAVGTTAPDSTLGTPDTVSVCLRFPEIAWHSSPSATPFQAASVSSSLAPRAKSKPLPVSVTARVWVLPTALLSVTRLKSTRILFSTSLQARRRTSQIAF
jgi:predicted dehydrogenase